MIRTNVQKKTKSRKLERVYEEREIKLNNRQYLELISFIFNTYPIQILLSSKTP